MKHFISMATLLISVQITLAQTEKINLSDYKLPEMKRHRLDFYFQSRGENSSSKYFYKDENESDTLKNENHQFNGTYNLGYSFYRNSPRIQSSISATTYGTYGKIKKNDMYIKQDNSNFNNNLSFNYDLKYFFTPSNWFVTAVPDYGLSYYNYKDKENEPNFEIKSFYTNASVGIGGGKGRIEQVQDFRNAILLIEELEKRGVSIRNVSEAEMIELSTLISQLKNKRFFDSRKQKEAELVALDSFFMDKGIIDEKSIQYYTGLEDIWSYGGLQVRESGKQILFLITPGYNFDKNLEDEGNNIDENMLMYYNLSFVSKNPISIKWQGNYGFGLNHEYMKRLRQQNDDLCKKSYDTRAFAEGEISYYPNTRTNLGLSSKVALSNISDENVPGIICEENVLDNKKYSAGLQITTSGYYYISEKLRLGYALHYSISKYGVLNKEVENTYFKTIFYNLTFNYSIF